MSLRDDIRSFGPAYGMLIGVSALASIGAVLTLVPNPGASWPNILGYKSLCTFAPGATFACALIAALSCTLRARLVRKTAAPAFAPIVALLLLGIGLAVSATVWAGEKAKYATDATTSASETVSPE
jgi:hypothetical protein